MADLTGTVKMLETVDARLATAREQVERLTQRRVDLVVQLRGDKAELDEAQARAAAILEGE